MPNLPKTHGFSRLGKTHEVKKKAKYYGWYGLKIWRELRIAVFRRDNWTCQMEGCGRNYGHNPSMLVCDHKKPHRGVWDLFIDMANLWTLCRSCHNSIKQAQEKKGQVL